MPRTSLVELAFGDLVPPPVPVTAPRSAAPRQRLLAAVVLGAQGRYAAATTALADLRRGADPVVASLAATTLASHRRQLGGHVAARALDGEALVALDGAGATRVDPDGLDAAGARADALLGLAADNLALGRLAAARRLAARAAEADDRWRATVRGGWVGAEIELAAGRPREAIAPARRAAETARVRGSSRHVVKSDIVLGVALATAGNRSNALLHSTSSQMPPWPPRNTNSIHLFGWRHAWRPIWTPDTPRSIDSEALRCCTQCYGTQILA